MAILKQPKTYENPDYYVYGCLGSYDLDGTIHSSCGWSIKLQPHLPSPTYCPKCHGEIDFIKEEIDPINNHQISNLKLTKTHKWHENRSCKSKIRYKTRKDAKTKLKILKSKVPTVSTKNMEAYHCLYCEGWHIGHKPSKEAKRNSHNIIKKTLKINNITE